MARQSKVAGEVSSIFGDLAKIAMSNTANKKAQELQLETNLIELELRTLNQSLLKKQEIYRLKQEQFQSTTGQAFKLSDEARTPGFEKAITSISDPMLQGHVDEINSTKGEISTLETQIAGINELLQGPLADITAFYQGAADPAFSGDETIIEASDMTPEALTAYLGDKYKDVDPNIIKGAQAKINVNTALAQLEVQKTSSDVNLALIQNQNAKTIAEAQSNFATIEGNQKNIDSGKRVLNSFIDSDILVNSISDVSLLEQVALNAQTVYTEKSNSSNKLLRDDAQAKLYNEYYEIGAALKGQEEIPYQDVKDTLGRVIEKGYVSIYGEEAANDMIAHGLQYHDAIKSTQSTTAKKGTNIPTINILLESYEGFLKDNPDTNWDKIEEITGYTQDMFERNVPIMRDGLEAIRVAEASNAALLPSALTGSAPPAPIVNDPDSTDPTDINRVEDEDYVSGVLDPMAISNTDLIIQAIDDIDYFSPFEDEIDPFAFSSPEPYDVELDLEITAAEQEELYMMATPKEYERLRSIVNRADELNNRLEELPITAENAQERSFIKDELSGAPQGAGGIKELFSKNLDVQALDAKKELEWAFYKKEQQTKTLKDYAESIIPGDKKFLQDLIELIGEDADAKLYSLDANALQEALDTLLLDISDEELVNMIDPQTAQILSREYWSSNANRRREATTQALKNTPDLSDSFWDLFTLNK